MRIKKSKKCGIAILTLCMSLILTTGVVPTYATSEGNNGAEVYLYTDAETGTEIEAIRYNENHIKVDVTMEDQRATCEKIGANYYLDGQYIDTDTVNALAQMTGFSGEGVSPNAIPSTVKWGAWQSNSKVFNVYKLSISGITAMLSTWLLQNGFTVTGIITAGVGEIFSGGYNYLKLNCRMRLGYDSTEKMNYAQQEFTFYGSYDDVKYTKIYGPELYTRKQSDK